MTDVRITWLMWSIGWIRDRKEGARQCEGGLELRSECDTAVKGAYAVYTGRV